MARYRITAPLLISALVMLAINRLGIGRLANH